MQMLVGLNKRIWFLLYLKNAGIDYIYLYPLTLKPKDKLRWKKVSGYEKFINK